MSSNKIYSELAFEIVDLSYKLEHKVWSDPDWSLLEAAQMETPVGEVHLHWTNHRGRGHWNLVTQPSRKWRGEICKSVRCRIVTITPHGGENESIDISRQHYEDAFENWIQNKRVEGYHRADLDTALWKAKEAKQKEQKRIRELIEADYGPWPPREAVDRWQGRRRGEWFSQLDEELRKLNDPE